MVASSVKTPELKLEHSDSRGEIFSITLPNNQEVMLLHSVKGSLRGGHAHDVDEDIILLNGRMVYYKKAEDGTEWANVLKAGETGFNPAGEVHMGEFTEDSWLLEFKINTKKGEWKNIDYEPYREKVRASIEQEKVLPEIQVDQIQRVWRGGIGGYNQSIERTK